MVKCELYQKLAVNEKQCSICKKTFTVKGSLNQHIGQNHKKELLEIQKSEGKFTSNETEGIKIMEAIKEHIEKLKNDKEKLSEFITTTNQILDQPDVECLGKKRKIECPSCHRILNKEAFNKHVVNCEFYQKLIKNETQCRVCDKTFATKLAINQHLGANHKQAVIQLQFDELGTMKKDTEKLEKK